MADIRPFSLGEVLQTSEAIKGMRQQSVTAQLQQKLLGVQTAGAQQAQDYAKAQESRAATQFSQEQQITTLKLLNAAGAEISKNPSAINRWLPQLRSAGIREDFDFSTVSPADIQDFGRQLFDGTSAAVQQLDPRQRERFAAPFEAVGPDGKPGMYVLDPTTGKPQPINLAPVPKPQRGLRIQSDGQGGFSLYEGDGAQGVALTKPTEGKLQATAVDAQSGIDRLSGIRQGFDPKWLTYTEQAKQFANNVRQKAAGLPFVSKLSPQEEADLAAFSSFKSDTLDNLNLYIKEITGAAMGVEEAKRIVSTLPSLDDSPAAFQSKLNRTEERLRLVLARSVYTQKQGIKFDAMPIEQMRGIINRRGDELARELKDPAAVRSALEAEFFR